MCLASKQQLPEAYHMYGLLSKRYGLLISDQGEATAYLGNKTLSSQPLGRPAVLLGVLPLPTWAPCSILSSMKYVKGTASSTKVRHTSMQNLQ